MSFTISDKDVLAIASIWLRLLCCGNLGVDSNSCSRLGHAIEGNQPATHTSLPVRKVETTNYSKLLIEGGVSRLALLSYMVHVNNPQGAPSMFTQIRQERVTPRWRTGVSCNHHSQLGHVGLRRKHTVYQTWFSFPPPPLLRHLFWI